LAYFTVIASARTAVLYRTTREARNNRRIMILDGNAVARLKAYSGIIFAGGPERGNTTTRDDAIRGWSTSDL
jgi:hypothetical protein